MRLLAAILSAILFAAPTPAAEAPSLMATFIGNMAVHLTDGSTALVTDFPYESGAFGYMRWTSDLVPDGPAPVCLITHSHRDHFASEAAGDRCAALLGPKDVTVGFDGEVVPMGETVRWGELTIRPIRTPHADLEHHSYRVSWRGQELYFTGDTEEPAALLDQEGLDVAFVSPWLLDAVLGRGERVNARQVIVYHHTADQKQVAYPDAHVPVQGERIPLAKSPAVERVNVLGALRTE